MRGLAWTMGDPRRYEAALRRHPVGAAAVARRPDQPAARPARQVDGGRDLPAPHAESFRAWWNRTRP